MQTMIATAVFRPKARTDWVTSKVKTSEVLRSTLVQPIITAGKLTGMKVDRQFDVQFDKSSGDTKQVELGVDPNIVVGRYVNGWFHIVDNQIIEHRDNKYTGFVHSPNSLGELGNRIGFLQDPNAHGIIARNRTSVFEHEAFSKGGTFDVSIGFRWSAFTPMIESHFEMVRALCSNQMIFGRDTVMSRNIPLINEWENNMAISNDVLKHIFNTTIKTRLLDMPHERASLADIELIQTIVAKQIGETDATPESRAFLQNLLGKIGFIDDYPNLSMLTVNDKKRIPVPVSVYDAMNIATEVSTHYLNQRSTKLQAFATSCIFDKKRQSNLISEAVFTSDSTFDDPDRAFWAETVH